jgi:tRNA(Ile)-lysidine synthase
MVRAAARPDARGVMTLPVTFARAFSSRFPDLFGKPILVALSGGSDSVALLHLLVETAGSLGCRPYVAHVHHHVRGAEADTDAEFCAELCGALGVPLVVAHLDPEPPRGQSPEAWWRTERYRLLDAERARSGCAATATGHTLDDQAETVLLKVLRGAGPCGAAGIRRQRGTVIRPLLDLRREELREWLRSSSIGWREDATNLAAVRPRVWLRRQVVPLLEAGYPKAVKQLGAFAEALGEDETFIAAALAGSAEWPAVGRPVACSRVAALPPALRSRWVLSLADRLPLAEPPSRVQLRAVGHMLDGAGPAAVDLGRHWVLRRRRDLLHLSPPPQPEFAPIAAVIPSATVLPGGLVAWIGRTSSGRARFTGTIGPRAAELPLAWRPLAPGERWSSGAGRPLARLLGAAGVPAECRRAWPLLDAGGTILWVPGVGVRAEWRGSGVGDILVELEVPW